MLEFKYKQTLWTDNIMQNFMHFIHKPHVLTSAMKNNTCLDMFGDTKWLKFHICHKEMRQQHQQTSNKVITQTFQPSWNQQFPRGHEFEEKSFQLFRLTQNVDQIPAICLEGRKRLKSAEVCCFMSLHSSTTGCTYPSSLKSKAGLQVRKVTGVGI